MSNGPNLIALELRFGKNVFRFQAPGRSWSVLAFGVHHSEEKPRWRFTGIPEENIPDDLVRTVNETLRLTQ